MPTVRTVHIPVSRRRQNVAQITEDIITALQRCYLPTLVTFHSKSSQTSEFKGA